MSMQSDEYSGNEGAEPGVVVPAMNVSMLGCPVWPCPFYGFVEAEDWAEWVHERLWWVDYVLNDVLVGTPG